MKEPESDEAYKLRMLQSMAQQGQIYKISYPPVEVEKGKPPVAPPDEYFVKMAARDGLARLDISSTVSTGQDGRVRHKIEHADLAHAVGGEDKLQPVLGQIQPEKTGMRTGGALWKATHGVGR